MVGCSFVFTSLDYVEVMHPLKYCLPKILEVKLQRVKGLKVAVLGATLSFYYVLYFLHSFKYHKPRLDIQNMAEAVRNV